MSARSMFAAFAALLVATPAVLRAQDAEADFVKARQQFVAGQPRAAAQTALIASLHIRNQYGRCRDEDVGTRLLEAEGKLEKLAAALRAGTVGNVKVLDQSLMQIDRILAEHHLQLAKAAMVRPRPEQIPVVAQDIDRGAYHFERSVTLDGHALAAEQATAVANARALVKTIDETKAIPQGATDVVSALERLVSAKSAVAATP